MGALTAERELNELKEMAKRQIRIANGRIDAAKSRLLAGEITKEEFAEIHHTHFERMNGIRSVFPGLPTH